MRMRPLFPVVLAFLVAALAPSALAASPPAAAKLLASSAAALEKKDGLHLEAELHALAKSDGSLTEAQVKKLVPPTDVTLKGDLSQQTIVIAGKLSASGQALAAELRLSGTELYVNFGGAWYGVKDTKAKGSGITIDTSAKQLTGALADLLRSGLEVKVSDGPKVDGVSTWSLTGSFDPKALAKLSKSSGLSTGSSVDVTQLAGKTAVTVLIGRDDVLPRRIEIVSTLTPKDMAAAKTSTGGLLPLPAAGTKGLKSESITVTVDLSKFGEKVAFDRPSSFKTLDKLFESLLGTATKTTKTTK